ncbi:MAG: hypothetical protein GAK29_00866 [Acinetobacter bereziniae]|uniref:Uncharacterized protein n=1 Tax=Acinetobacter bereziniae TaxID=106648 RepID=A0A833UX39_ACIBZ|nr:MAG: hypothetical protein GAK29_00866 [Acinetobacter bereziniae]
MIPFEKIPRGLRVPLFFGELAVNGDVITSVDPVPQTHYLCSEVDINDLILAEDISFISFEK